MVRIVRALAVFAVLATVSPAHADETTAQAAFRQAEALSKQGKWAEACPLYEASFRADQQIGVLLHVADCHERIGRTATAWSEFNDAVELARRKQDNRAAYAQSRADALAPKLSKMHIMLPKAPPPGLVVKRDGADITPLLGSELPIDPGEHELVVSAPGFLDWHKQVTITATATTTHVQVGELEHVKVEPVTPPGPTTSTTPTAPRDGIVEITTQPGGQIAIDEQVVGKGHYQGAIKPGRHVLDVTDDDMGARPYHNEIYVMEGETRSFDVPLVRAERVVAPAPVAALSAWELVASIAPGVKRNGDDPAMVAFRIEIGKRWRHVNLGFYVEAAGISASQSCGTDLPGPTPSGPYDLGSRGQFADCFYVMPGVQLYVHPLSEQTWDPWIGVAPGFRLGGASYTKYNALGQMTSSEELFLPGAAIDVRAGVDYHLKPHAFRGWAFGAFVDAQIMAIAQETDKSENNNGGGQAVSYVSFLGGFRTSLVF
jgi:hypothetical protein